MGAYETEEAGQWGGCQAVLGNQTGWSFKHGELMPSVMILNLESIFLGSLNSKSSLGGTQNKELEDEFTFGKSHVVVFRVSTMLAVVFAWLLGQRDSGKLSDKNGYYVDPKKFDGNIKEQWILSTNKYGIFIRHTFRSQPTNGPSIWSMVYG